MKYPDLSCLVPGQPHWKEQRCDTDSLQQISPKALPLAVLAILPSVLSTASQPRYITHPHRGTALAHRD